MRVGVLLKRKEVKVKGLKNYKLFDGRLVVKKGKVTFRVGGR